MDFRPKYSHFSGFQAKNQHFLTKNQSFLAKIRHFLAKISHFGEKISHVEVPEVSTRLDCLLWGAGGVHQA